MQTVSRISQAGTKSVFSQSGNSREVTPILVAQTQSSGPQTRYGAGGTPKKSSWYYFLHLLS